MSTLAGSSAAVGFVIHESLKTSSVRRHLPAHDIPDDHFVRYFVEMDYADSVLNDIHRPSVENPVTRWPQYGGMQDRVSPKAISQRVVCQVLSALSHSI